MARTKTTEVDPAAANDEKIVQMRNEGSKWADIAEAVGLPTGKAMFRYEVATCSPKDRIKDATPEKIAELRDDGVSWGRIAARTGLPESRVRTLFEEGGRTALGHRIGKGGRYPGQNLDGEAPKPRSAKKAKEVAPKEQSARVVELGEKVADGLEATQAFLTGRGVKLGDGTVIKVRSVKAVKDGALQVVDHDSGRARTLKVANITAVTANKVVKAEA